MYSSDLRKSNTFNFSFLVNFLKTAESITFTFAVNLPCIIQVFMPPFRNPRQLSKPTRANLVTVSSTLSSCVTNKIGFVTSSIIVPTQGAKLPSIPINIEFGMCSLANCS